MTDEPPVHIDEAEVVAWLRRQRAAIISRLRPLRDLASMVAHARGVPPLDDVDLGQIEHEEEHRS